MNITELVREAGIYDGREGLMWCSKEQLERFAALVTAEKDKEIAELYEMSVKQAKTIKEYQDAEPVKQEPVAAMKKPNVAVITADVRAALCFALWHHQGGSSSIGQPIREMLGLGQHDHMTSEQYFAAKRVAEAMAEQEILGKHTCLSEKQEPVAWMWRSVDIESRSIETGLLFDRGVSDENTDWTPLYAAPVSAKMQGDCTLAEPKCSNLHKAPY